MNNDSKNSTLISKSDAIFNNSQAIEHYDPDLWSSVKNESIRQEEHIELIASENYASTEY